MSRNAITRNRFRGGTWTNKHQPDAPAPAPRPLTMPVEPTEHRVVTPTHPQWFRVMRVVLEDGGGLAYECVGEFPTLARAVVLASLEKFRSRVTDAHGTVHFDSWRPARKGGER